MPRHRANQPGGKLRSTADRRSVSARAPTPIATNEAPKTEACSHAGSAFTPDGATSVRLMLLVRLTLLARRGVAIVLARIVLGSFF